MDEFKFYHDALAGKNPSINEGLPQSGFYKMRRGKDGPYVAVAIYTVDGKLIARVSGSSNYVDPNTLWTYCAHQPIAKNVAKAVFAGEPWPGDAPEAGHNSCDLTIAEQIKDYAAQALAWLRKSGVKDSATKDMAANYRAELLRLTKEADKQREDEKRPHDTAAKAVQAKWKPIIEASQGAADEIRDALTAFMTAEKRRLEAEQRVKWEAEQKAAEAARAAQEAERAKLMRDDPISALTTPEPEPVKPVSMPVPVKVQAGGQRGRKTGLREVTRYVVTDHAKALEFFAGSEDVRELVAKLAERACKAGVEVPGTEKRVEEVAA